MITTIVILSVFSSFYLYWQTFKSWLMENEYKKNKLIRNLVFSTIPGVNLVISLYLAIDILFDPDNGLSRYRNRLNAVATCPKCNISSREWQLKQIDNSSLKCPHCDNSVFSYASYSGRNEEYPFARKLGFVDAIKRRIHNRKLENNQIQLERLELYDNEMASYQEIQMNKLKEYEKKVEEIKLELGVK